MTDNNPTIQGTRAVEGGVHLTDPDDTTKQVLLEGYPFGPETRYASSVTGPELVELCDSMQQMLEGQRLTNLYLSRLIGETLTADDVED